MPQLRSRRGVGVGVGGSFECSVDESDGERSDAPESAASGNRRAKRAPQSTKRQIQLHDDYYMGYLPPSQRYEMTMYLMRKQHRWSIHKFLRAMVLEETSKNTFSKSKRTADLASAIFDDPDIAEALVGKIDFKSHFAQLFIQKLTTQVSGEFDKVGKLPGMGVFKPTIMPETLRLDNLAERVCKAMPTFFAMMKTLMTSRSAQNKIETPFFTLVFIIARCRHRQLNNNFPTMLGIYLHSLGLKRRALAVLSGLGLIPSYRRLMLHQHDIARFTVTVLPKLARLYRRRFLICWDNFDYRDDVHHVTAANRGNHVCTTTGLFLESLVIPPEGISVKDFKPEIPLNQYHLLDHGSIRTDETEKKLQEFFILEALRSVYGSEIDEVFNKTPASRSSKPAFPSVRTLGEHKTNYRELGPIKYNEGTLSGTFDVIEDIFKRVCQLKEDDAAFAENIQLTFGDQKTVSLVQSVKRLREHSKHAFGNYSFLLPIPGLFHYRMNFVDLIEIMFRGQKGGEKSPTSIHHNVHYMGIARGDNIPFHQKEAIVIRCFNARVIAVMYEEICRRCDIGKDDDVKEVLQQSSATELLSLVERVRLKLYSERQHRSAKDEGDEVFANIAQFADMVTVYLTLKEAIRNADVELIARSFVRSAFFLIGTKKKKYAMLALYMTWLTHAGTTSEILREAILANGLVNLQGKANTWFEIDRLNELLNLKLKTIMKFRRTSTEDPNDLFVRTALISEYLSSLKIPIEELAGEKTDSTHRDKKASEDIRRLSYHLWDIKATIPHAKRSCALKPPYPAEKTFSNIDQACERFNEMYCKEPDPLVDVDGDTQMVNADGEDAAQQDDDEIEAGPEDLVDEEDREGLRQLMHGDDDDAAFIGDAETLDD